MELVLDANILFAALLKAGLTRELMLSSELVLYTPEFIVNEFFKHLSRLQNRVGVDKETLESVMRELLTQAGVKVIPKKELMPFMNKAVKISPDSDDALYFATALRLKCGIWSNDKKLKEQDLVRVYSTKDLVGLF